MSFDKKPNQLINEKSPYLLQHAYNPVNWYPWCEEAFVKAKRENKPVFVSIGYSTCHWCHVMEKESFEDEEVAAILNEKFISVKVDREERPDIDSIYMSVCQVLTGHGGWPLHVFLTPDQIPFYAGVYFPKTSRHGRPGMLDILPQLSNIFENDKEKIEQVGNNIIEVIDSKINKNEQTKVHIDLVHECYQQLNTTFEPMYGGFGDAPKFPLPTNLLFLLRYYSYSKDERALYMVEKTLQSMAAGGIYDHIGFGFSRYSTDEEWLVPHFEKMLYDNAMLAIAYIEAYQLTKNKSYQQVVGEIFTYIFRDMQHPSGGFYSAEDADSEGVEGKFYVWKREEIINVLGPEEGEFFCSFYNITEEGNFEGATILNVIDKRLEDDCIHENVIDRLNSAREKLFVYREKRIHPHKDDKILTSWNALMIVALAKAARVFSNEKYETEAVRALSFIEDKLMINNVVMVRFREGEVKQEGFIDDYAFLLWAYIELYETTFTLTYLEKANKLVETIMNLFWDKKEGGFFFTSNTHEKLFIRKKETYDGPIPSGNGVLSLQLLRLARLTGNSKIEETVEKLLQSYSNEMEQYPAGYTFSMQTILLTQTQTKEVIILQDSDTEVSKYLQKAFHPEITYIVAKNIEELKEIAPFTKEYHQTEHTPLYYICKNFVCHKPTTDEETAMEYIKE